MTGDHDDGAEVQRAFQQLVGGLDYPMYVVTAAGADGQRAGCLVGFATQASIDPGRVLVLLSKENETFRIAQQSQLLGVHYLHEGNRALASLFGEESGDWTDKFARCEWREGPGGVPMIAGVRGVVVGRVLARLDAGDHVAHLLDPVAVEVGEDRPALTYQAVRDLDPGHPA
ncbi:MAG TPA: flavin reductase family protein [Mycobacteriales bacterium]|nr:flavin reductase family protein [Mycobacteriales bacterium]